MSRSAVLTAGLVCASFASGCQSVQSVAGRMRPSWMPRATASDDAHTVVPVLRETAIVDEPAEHANVSVAGPDETPLKSETQQTGFWSRLKSPSRFLLPRTDVWLGNEDSEMSQDFDSGF